MSTESTHPVDPVAALEQGEREWKATPLAARVALLSDLSVAVAEHAREWVEAASAIKLLRPGSPLVGEEWLSGPYPVLACVAALSESLQALSRGGSPVDGFSFVRAPGGRVGVRVLPHTIFERLLFSGFKIDVWMAPGVQESTVRERAGLAQRTPAQTGGVALVLGAGNISSIGTLDVLYQLFAHNRVAVLKLNPVTDQLQPVLERALEPLIAPGFLRIVTGGAEVGSELANDPRVAAVHMTGSAATHDAIVFGSGDQGMANKAAGRRLLEKPITSELGGVSPTIVLPGKWSSADLRFQAEHVVTQKLHNGGFNCVASQVLVLSSDWAQKNAFLDAIRAALRSAPAREQYYPGCEARIGRARAAYPAAEELATRWLITGLDLRGEEPALGDEYFAPVLGVAELPGLGRAFLSAAIGAVNERLAGTLGVNIIAHPSTLSELKPTLLDAVAELRYGTVAINAWTAVGYLAPRASWGAFPGHTLSDIQSGIGVVHNALLLENPERSVVRGPFRPAPRSVIHGELALSPKPPWFVTNHTAATTGRRMTAFTAQPSWGALPGIFASALRG